MVKATILLDYTNLFSLNEYKGNKQKTLKCFQLKTKDFFDEQVLKKLGWKKYIVLGVMSTQNLKNPEIWDIFDKILVLTWNKFDTKDEKMFKEKESNRILKILGLINNIEKYQINI